MALQSCYECNKEISTKAIMCPQCGAPQNPVPNLIDKAKEGGGFLLNAFKKVKEEIKEIQRDREFGKEGGELEEMLDKMNPMRKKILREKEEKESKTILSKFRPKE